MNFASEPLSIERRRELLDTEADDLSEEEIAAVRDHADAMAYLIVDMFREQRSKSGERDDDISAV